MAGARRNPTRTGRKETTEQLRLGDDPAAPAYLAPLVVTVTWRPSVVCPGPPGVLCDCPSGPRHLDHCLVQRMARQSRRRRRTQKEPYDQ